MRYKLFILIFSVFLAAFMPASNKLETINQYNFRFLKNASAPRYVKVFSTIDLSGNNKIITKGILFSYKNRGARRVSIAGNFSLWKNIPMKRSKNGVWYYYHKKSSSLPLLKYKYNIDGIWIADPENFYKEDDKTGSYLSCTNSYVEKEGEKVFARSKVPGLVEFRVFNKSARFISVVGSFNSWNPENDLLRRGSDGIWRLKKRLSRGVYRYKYIIDGKWVVDLYNVNTSFDNTGSVCSVVKVK